MMSGNEIMPITLDDFEGEDRKSMEEYIKEITQEALMRDRKSTRLNSSHATLSRMPSSA